MSKRVLDVGQCQPDHQSIRDLLQHHFDVAIDQTHGPEDTLDALQNVAYVLVLINRKLDQDYSDGLEIIKRIKADPETAHVPVMMVTNYAEHQDLAVAVGAERGFGKLQYEEPETYERLARFLS